MKKFFRFKLRTFLLFVLLFSPILAWIGSAVHQRNVEGAEIARFQTNTGLSSTVVRGGELRVISLM